MEKCCATCTHCDFYFEELPDDYYEYWACDLGRAEFNYDAGGPCERYE